MITTPIPKIIINGTKAKILTRILTPKYGKKRENTSLNAPNRGSSPPKASTVMRIMPMEKAMEITKFTNWAIQPIASPRSPRKESNHETTPNANISPREIIKYFFVNCHPVEMASGTLNVFISYVLVYNFYGKVTKKHKLHQGIR